MAAPFSQAVAAIAGDEADAVAPIFASAYDTTLCLTVTSVHPYQAGAQASLVDVLADHGAKFDGVAGDGAALGCALLFVDQVVDARAAAMHGRLPTVRALLDASVVAGAEPVSR